MPNYRTHSEDEQPTVVRHDAPAPLPFTDPAQPDATAARHPEDAPCETGARHLTDAQLRALLDDVRARAAHAEPAVAPELEAALASLECEVASRGLLLSSDVSEPTPPRLAFQLFLRALATTDRDLATRALPWIEPSALFVAYRRIREHDDRPFRIYCLAYLLFRLDAALLDIESARWRQNKLRQCGLEPADLEAFIELCIASMFTVAYSSVETGGEE